MIRRVDDLTEFEMDAAEALYELWSNSSRSEASNDRHPLTSSGSSSGNGRGTGSRSSKSESSPEAPMLSLMNSQQLQPSTSSADADGLPQILADFRNSSDEDDDTEEESEVGIGKCRSRQLAHCSRFDRDGSSNSHDRISQRQVSPQGSRSIMCSTPVSAMPIPMTRDQGTQTDDTVVVVEKAQLKVVDKHILDLYSKFLLLANQVKELKEEKARGLWGRDNAEMSDPEQNSENRSRSSLEQAGESGEAERSLVTERSDGSLMAPRSGGALVAPRSGGSLVAPANEPSTSGAKPLEVRRVSAHTTAGHEDEMVPIGDCSTMIPRRILLEIDWSNYSIATRQLLQAVFPRRVLATHSLSGKVAPAFRDRPQKKGLNRRVVDDIIKVVHSRCGVDPKKVRLIITAKCTDEARLYRNRQRTRQANQNQENVPPADPSSDESSPGPSE